MIGLYKAIRDFNGEKQVSFRAFSEICITRQMITAIKTATRQKHIPLNSYISFSKPLFDDGSERTLVDTLVSPRNTNPEELIICREDYEATEIKIGELLTDLERRVLESYLAGKSYQQIAAEHKRGIKSIDNALQRVKRKLEAYLQSRGPE